MYTLHSIIVGSWTNSLFLKTFWFDGALKIVIGSYSYTTMPKTTSRVLPTMLCFLTYRIKSTPLLS